jgi:hypothetical protein
MLHLTVEDLAALSPREYIGQIKLRLSNEEQWKVLVTPALKNRTRWGLGRIVSSIDVQKVRNAEMGPVNPAWLLKVNALRRMAQGRLEVVDPRGPSGDSSTREAKAWRAFSATLARLVESYDPEALVSVQAPYGGMTALQWLQAREAKQVSKP